MSQIYKEIHLKLLRHLENYPNATQRQLADELGVSLGKANYCLKALIDRGLIKAKNFKNSNQKSAYVYLLTPSGVEEKMKISLKFLQLKMEEYEALENEIKQLRLELENSDS